MRRGTLMSVGVGIPRLGQRTNGLVVLNELHNIVTTVPVAVLPERRKEGGQRPPLQYQFSL